MIDLSSARDIASKSGHAVNLSAAHELREGWFFPASGDCIGSNGIIVNKKSGRMLALGSAFPLERDLRAYDDGYQFETCDLVVTAVADMDAAVRTLAEIGPTVIEPEFADGRVWRVPRHLKKNEIRARLGRLPCIFERTRLYFVRRAPAARTSQVLIRFCALSRIRPGDVIRLELPNEIAFWRWLRANEQSERRADRR